MGHTGWFNLSGDTTECYYPVIVKDWKKSNGTTYDKVTSVYKESVKEKETKKPTSRAEAILRQHPKIEMKMDDVCRMLAQCDLNPNSKTILKIFQDKLMNATKRQQKKGLYRKVNFDHEELISA